MRLRPRISLILAAIAALAAALSIRIPFLDVESRSITLLDVSMSHGPDAAILFERARRQGADGGLVVFGREARVVCESGPWPAELPVLEADFTAESNFGAGCRAVTAMRDVAGCTVRLITDGAFNGSAYADGKAILLAANLSLEVIPPLAQPAEGLFLEVPSVAEAYGNTARVAIDVVSTARRTRRVQIAAVASGAVIWSGEVVAGGRLRMGGDVPIGPATTSVRVSIKDSGGADLLTGTTSVDVPVERAGRRIVGVLGDVPTEQLTSTLGFDVQRCGSWHDAAKLAGRCDLIIVADAPVLPKDADDLSVISRAVTHFGVGLVVIGGPRAYRDGGYANSALAALLPIDCGLAAKDIRVALDRSGSMERDGRWRRAIEAVESLARATSDSSTLWVLPFSQEPGLPIPQAPSPASVFLASGVDTLLRLAPSGGTRIVPAIRAAMAIPVAVGSRALLAVISDFDDPALDVDLGTLLTDLVAARIEVIAFLIDPSASSSARASRISSRVVPVDRLDNRILTDSLETQGFQVERTLTRTPGGGVGPEFSARHRVTLSRDARADLVATDGAPILATAERGRGRVLGLAAPYPSAELVAELALRAARPTGVDSIRASYELGILTVKVSPATRNLVAPIVARGPGTPAAWGMSEVGPGLFRSTPGIQVGGGPWTLEDASGGIFPFAVPPPVPSEWREPRRQWPSVPSGALSDLRSRWIWGALGLALSLHALRSRT